MELPCSSKTLMVLIGLSLSLSCGTDPDPEEPTTIENTLRCEYRNAFNGEPECKEYTGSDWTSETAGSDCEVGIPGGAGTFFENTDTCVIDPIVGRCDVPSDAGLDYYILLGGDDPGLCTGAELACETFAVGTFTPDPVCEEPPEEDDHTVFIWPYQTCSDPIEGEEAGTSEDGQVCVWESINGCVEEGRAFRDYGSCDVVETNRPYYPVDGAEPGAEDDPRMSDATYLEDVAWVASQVQSCACVCCHSQETEEGPAIWSVDGPTLWPDMMSDQAIGMFAGYVDSSALGYYDPAVNNGFDRNLSGMPSTDPDRMVAFWLQEFDRRGLTPEDMEDYLPVGSSLLDQIDYELPACEAGDEFASDGTITWADERDARYLYILEEGSSNPGVPPNYDLPEGTIWRVDVPHTEEAFPTGLTYGEVPGTSFQFYPAEDEAPATLVSGQTYHLYVLYDVALPIARCYFTAP